MTDTTPQTDGVDFLDSEGRRYRIYDTPVRAPDDDITRQIRIEALHAASRIVAGASFGSKITIDNGKEGTDQFTVDLARQLVKYLKDG